ncbi:alpha-L-arabinofuranosidase C-terminal domain-containing protein [Paenibacillus arenilitoris]|uniref:non-reducing end alpha-L-arabinofuranosidase n=1 Tax=Paenibacillus arenilitoris TaxID=2772299 RepID=A0A927CJR5_9BACL|nr:alpha-L-arabinofuranosidase C-terminal domain-containing protein [Paenibacillus arenilitoris]MBD2867161.1 carbohydrate binding domain-containing protein [Paenibacillus arenilitoris]
MSEQAAITVYARERGAELGDLFGIFFEDLNHAADGGLYAELVQNRSFEFDPIDHPDYDALTAWEKVERGGGKASLTIGETDPVNARNRHYAVIEIETEGGGVGLMNRGFNTGIPVKQGESYAFSVYARRDGSVGEPVRVTLEGADGQVYGQAVLHVGSSEWAKYEAVITADATDYGGRLAIVTKGSGRLCLDLVSLFPVRTFRGRSNGLREDIASLIADLKPKFMRFPGGCLVHDGSLDADDRDSMYRWKNTIGPLEERPARRNNWRYNQTLGLGYYEYFLFCEDIGAKPIPILPAGYDPHHKRIVPLDELQPWIDDALDLIEFARGDASTEWGGIRAKLGHPEPFGLEYIGIGNEEVGEPFFERYAYFHRAIKAKYPDIKVINSSGPFAAGGEYERGWASARENGSDLVDEHYYQSPEWFLANYDRYDRFKADESKVFLGEYASWGNTYYNALAEAAFMTGLEKNAHAVGLACYAPMLCNVDYINWKPDMIWFNNREAFGTANYYVQQLFMHHQGDHLLKIEASGLRKPAARPPAPIAGALSLGTELGTVQYWDIRLVNDDTGETLHFEGLNETLTDSREDRERGSAKRSLGLGRTDWERYTLHLKAKKHSGPRGFYIHFGQSDEHNHFTWEFGGWQNQDSVVVSKVSGRGSCLTQSLLTVETGTEYELALSVSGRSIRTYVNGELINETEDRLPVIEPLYYTASADRSTGDVIVKVVNVQDENVCADVVVAGSPASLAAAEVFELSGHGLDEENDFESPKRIAPKRRELRMSDNRIAYEFPKHSVTIFRVKETGAGR